MITGTITDLDQDMIEIKTYPDGKTIYIDFGYKGLPKNLPLDKVVLRDPPMELSKPSLSPVPEQGESYLAVETPISPTETEVQEPAPIDFKSDLDAFIANVDQIRMGDDLGSLTEVVELEDEFKRFGLEKQTNDLLDDLLAEVPMADRTRTVLNNIHTQISRFKQLRSLFSSFDSYDNITGPVRRGADYKPLAIAMEKLDTKLPWMLPVAVTRKKIYDMGTVETEDVADIVPLTLAQSRIAESEITEDYKTNSVPSGENKLDFLYQSLHPFMTPFDPPASDEGLIGSLPVGTDITVLQDNTQDDFNSITVGQDGLQRYQFLVTNFTDGLSRLEQDKEVTIPGEYKTVRVTMTRPDVVPLKSYLMLPMPAIRFSRVSLPGSDIMLKTNLSKNFLNYWQVLNRNTFISSVVVDELDSSSGEKFRAVSKLGDDESRFFNATEYLCSEDIEDPKKLSKFIETIVPRTRTIFNLLKKSIVGKYTLTGIVGVLEPFLVYYHDIAYKLYEEIAQFLDENIIEFKKRFLQRSKEYNMLTLHRYRIKRRVSPLVSAIADNPEMSASVVTDYLKFGKSKSPLEGNEEFVTTSELLFRMIKEDACRYYSDVIAYSTLPLHMDIDIESILKQSKERINEAGMQSGPNPCSKLVIAKKYRDKTEMEEDNGNSTVYFDPQHDDTRYDIMEEYKSEQRSMPPEEFQPFLIKRLRETIGLNLEEASRDADSMIRGKKIIREGDLAIVPEETDSGSGNYEQVVYERKDNQWLKSGIDGRTIANDGVTTCSVNDSCFQIKKSCLDTASATNEIQKNGIDQMLKEFDDQLSLSLDELSRVVEKNLVRSREQLPLIGRLRRKETMKYNNMKNKIGATVSEGDIIVSPAASVRDFILGQEDIVKKNADILLFVDRFCRASFGEEDKFWLYCNQTQTKLLPTFINELAMAFNIQQNANDYEIYTATLDRICNEQGVFSDDGNSYVDKYSGYEIMPIELNDEEGFDTGGRKIVSRGALEKDLGSVVGSDNIPSDPEDPDAIAIKNVVLSVCGFLGVEGSEFVGFVTRNTMLIISKTLSSEDEHEKKVKIMAAKGKKIPSFREIKGASLLLLSLGGLLIAIQTSIPPIRTRKTFPGCKRSFSGFPFSGDTDFSGLDYIACVAHKLKSNVAPWNAIKGMNQASIAKKIKDLVTKYMMEDESVKERISQRREYDILNDTEFIPVDHDISLWIGFLPPPRIAGLELQKPLTKEAESILIDSVRQGSKKQFQEEQTVRGKIIYHSFEIQALIQKVVKSQSPLVVNSLQEPFLVNSCCNETNLLSTIQYFNAKEGDILVLNERVRLLQLIISDLRFFGMAPLINDTKDTRSLFPSLSNQFSEETIYRAFIVFCKYNNNLPLEPELLRICSDKPKQFDRMSGISSQIDYLKKSGKNFDNEMLMQLLKVINQRNQFIPDTEVSGVSVLQDYQGLLRKISDENNSIVSPQFIEKMEAALDTFDMVTEDDSAELRALKNYLGKSNEMMTSSISSFLRSHSNSSSIKPIVDMLKNMEKWSPVRESMGMSGEDNTAFRMIEFTRNMMRNLIEIVPTIVLNKVDYESVKVPKHWGLSEKHEVDIKKMIAKYYSPLKKFYDDQVARDVLSQASQDASIYVKFCDLTPALATPDSADKPPLFNSELVFMLFKFYTLNAIYQFILLTDSPQFAREVQPALAVSLSQTAEGAQSDLLESLADDTISEVQIVRGESLQLKEHVASYLLAVLSIEVETKDALDLNYDQIMERVLRAKEKEKDLITSFLRDLTDEERELENLFKNNKLERWSKGLQKGVTQYVKETYDEERTEMENQIRREREIGENNFVSNMNLNIYSMELQESENAVSDIEREVNDMSGLPDDDDYGERDGDEAY